MKAYVLYRQLKGSNGTAILHTIGVASSDKLIKEMADHAVGFMTDIEAAKVVVQTPNGPRAVMSVAQLLVELGIAEIGYQTMSGEVQDSTLVVPRNMVTLQ